MWTSGFKPFLAPEDNAWNQINDVTQVPSCTVGNVGNQVQMISIRRENAADQKYKFELDFLNDIVWCLSHPLTFVFSACESNKHFDWLN